MTILLFVGRILFGLIFVGAGIANLSDAQSTVDYAQTRRLRVSKLLVRIVGVVIIAGGLGVILGIWMDLAALGLLVFLLVTAVSVHTFWTDENQSQTQAYEISQFTKNISMAGGALIIFVLAGSKHDLGPTLIDSLFCFTL